MKNKNIFKFLIKIVISAVLFAYIYVKMDKGALAKNLTLIDLRFTPLILICIILNYIVSSYRWKQLLVHNNSDKASVEYLTNLYFIGSFFNNFMPTSIGGDVYKVFKLGKKIGSTSDAFAATFMERFTGVLVLALFSLLAFAGMLKYWVLLILPWFFVSIYVAFYLLKRLKSRIKFLEKVYDSLLIYRNYRGILFKATMVSVVVQLLSVMTQYLIFLSLGIKLNPAYALFTFPAITLATFFIPSLNGIGVQDGLYVLFFGMARVIPEISLAASVFYHLFRLGTSLIGGVLYAMGKSD